MTLRALLVLLDLAYLFQIVSAGGNDWINPSFVLQKSGATGAQKTITSYARSSAKKGPWTVYGGDGDILPPNEDKLDYLSWAPYHWPDCNWCQSGRAHLSTGGNRTGPEAARNETQVIPDEDGGDVEYDDDGGDDDSQDEGEDDQDDDSGDDSMIPSLDHPVLVPRAHRRMMRRTRRFGRMHEIHGLKARRETGLPGNLPSNLLTLPTPDSSTSATSTTADGIFTSQTGVENARKTSKPKPKPKGKNTHKAAPTKTKGGGSKCTPSPTKALPPSATWTTCKYVTRDGKLNPDVRKLHGVQAIADASQSILYNAVANILTGSASYAQSAAQAINVFFLDPQSGMHPRVEYGQVIRGPQKQVGQYLGVLDFRGMVKVANAILIMQAVNAPAWTSNLQSEMKGWTTQYIKWLQSSGIGKKAISAPNNHGSFAANQVAAMNILAGDTDAATGTLESYFNGQFRDQIAASGEQPFEAVRTRPFHYRCFNLEAMITNAKLGDQLGLNFWTAESKYGATIKDALDFVMNKGPGKERVSDIFPHVAAIAAIYGDPGGKYMAYLRKLDSHFMTAPYYYYDQPAAIHHAQKSVSKNGQIVVNELIQQPPELQVLEVKQTDSRDDLASQRPSIPWECPTVFAAALRAQLDDGVFVTCEELRPFYGYVADAGNDV